MKAYSALALDAVVECLRTVYWYSTDLRSFLLRAGVPATTVSALPWGLGTYKRTIARQLVDALAAEPTVGTPILEKLIDALVEMDDRLPHLARLDDGKTKEAQGKDALRALREIAGAETLLARAERARAEARTEAERSRRIQQERMESLAQVSARFRELCKAGSDQSARRKRGYAFQHLMRDLFALHDLDPRGSFASPGEQVDGSIRLDSTHILVEMKWETPPIEPKDVRDFRGKLQTKLDNTLGLMISMSGFTDQAIEEAQRGGRISVVLMEGQDVAQVFEAITDLTELLRRKYRHAADHGRAMYHVGD
jgi:hypothetical protein